MLQADESALDLGIERQRLAGRDQAGAAAFEQGEADLMLEVADHAADRGLADIQQTGRRADAAGQHQGAEGFDLPGIQTSHEVYITFCYVTRREFEIDVAIPTRRTLS